IQTLYYTGHTTKQNKDGFYFYVTLEAKTPEGTYYLNDRFLKANQIAYVHYDDCLLKLTKEAVSLNVYCKPMARDVVQERKPETANVQLGPLF
ncbi:zonular occludens toxin domain-containing protein, partial [Vibrio vulnificus]